MKTARQMMYGNAPLPSVDAAPGGGGTPAPPTEWTGGVQPPAVPQRTHNLPPRDPATGQFTEADLIAAREQAAREVEERLTGRPITGTPTSTEGTTDGQYLSASPTAYSGANSQLTLRSRPSGARRSCSSRCRSSASSSSL
jgi:hypothetical protein